MTLLWAVAAAVVLLALPGALDRVGRRLAPQEWAKLSAFALASGLVLLEIVLILRAAPTVLRAGGVEWLADACERVLRPLVAGGSTVGWIAGLAAVAMPAKALARWHRGRRLRRRLTSDLWLGDQREIAGYPVVVLPISCSLAVSIEHAEDKAIVISAGLLDVLDETRLEAVIAHEVAHLRHGHQRLLSLATAAEGALGWLPPLARTTSALRLAVERWADEEAAAAVAGGRHAVRDSLLVLAGVSPLVGAAAFSDAATIAARVLALDAPAPPPRPFHHALLYMPGTVAGATAAPALVTWGGHVHMLLAMSGRCTI